MEGDGGHSEEADEGGGEYVLGRVLLHVIASARRVDFSADAGAGLDIFEGSFQIVDDMTIFGICDFGDAKSGIWRD